MFLSSSKLRSLKRDKRNTKSSKSYIKYASNTGNSINSLNRNIIGNIEQCIKVRNINSVIDKINQINSGFAEAISNQQYNYNNLLEEIDQKIREEENFLEKSQEDK
ncbi:hypothetical protein [Clostridium baratii]|uniref:hypothetical protein n=1 Tax=Clostridium baratii TaxID=1561 RepID=UPI0029095883|nr:hypothetical protein [Clostridium baratii]MDU4910900.1 hypothetical protein [Clostridium baratii]